MNSRAAYRVRGSDGKSSRRRLDRRRHRPLAAADEWIGAEGVNLIALQLRVLLCRRQHDDATLRVYLVGHLKAPLARVAEQLLQHGDDVIETVVVVVEQHDVIRRLPLDLALFLLLELARLAR